MTRTSFLLACVLLAAGCKTGVVNPFVSMRPDYTEVPVEEVKNAAMLIEAAVKSGNRDFDPATITGIRVDTEEIMQAIRTRAARQQLVDEFLNTGHAYEQNNGLLNVKRSSEYKKLGTSRDRDRQALLVMGENTDRWALYEGILEANNYSGRALSAIQNIFHEARIAQLDAGQKYQDEAGEIIAK